MIGNPQHPYTKMLIDSIPWPDLNRSWGSPSSAEEDMRKLAQIEADHQTVFRGEVPGFDLRVADPRRMAAE